jgi:large-conductance mechanosensitive channel
MTVSNNNSNSFFDQLKQFIVNNNIVGTTAGVCIGIVTKDLITTFVGDIVIPLFLMICIKLNIKSLTKILPSGKSSFDFISFIRELVSWVIILIISFLFIRIAFVGLLGIPDNKYTSNSSNSTSSNVNNISSNSSSSSNNTGSNNGNSIKENFCSY